MIVLSAALAIAAFLVGFQVFGIVPTARRIVATMQAAGRVLGDRSLSDAEKEKAAQTAGIATLGGTFSLFVRVALTLLGTAVPIYLLGWMGLAPSGDVIAFLARIDVIIGASIVVMGGLWLWSRRPARPDTGSSAYSAMDKLAHRLAFAAPFVQATAADVEDSIFAKDIDGIENAPPVFITSLPRAGTTIVLNALHELPGVATHLYRDMPFIMAPLFWSRLSGFDRKQATLSERAHGDGIEIGFDSPEAFEEVIWRHFWPGHYRGDRIAPWTSGETDAEAKAFFQRHFRKIVALRTGPGGRYVSKNNGNIARLDLLTSMFPDCSIILPLRDPAEHAASLLRQHENFLELHDRDPFVRRYMRDIGHYEFGRIHKPVAFDGFAELAGDLTPADADYWLAYWIAAMDHAASRDGLVIAPDTTLQAHPQQAMSAICRLAGLDAGDTDFTRHFRRITPRADTGRFDAGLLARAAARYGEMAEQGRKILGM